MTTTEMRERLKRAPKYAKSQSWAHKVDNMSEAQVTAIYIRFERANLLG